MGMPDKIGSMNVVRAVASICSLIVCTSFSIDSQQSQPSAQTPTFRVQSSLVLVDVITKDRNSGLPIQDFQRKDFRLLDNRREVPITTFDAGARYDARPIILWLVVICNESGLDRDFASSLAEVPPSKGMGLSVSANSRIALSRSSVGSKSGWVSPLSPPMGNSDAVMGFQMVECGSKK